MLDKIFGRKLDEGEYIELDTSAEDAGSGHIKIKIDKMEDFIDSDRILKAIRNDAIVLVKIKKLRERLNKGELELPTSSVVSSTRNKSPFQKHLYFWIIIPLIILFTLTILIRTFAKRQTS